MNSKRQTIWLVSMLSLMVVLSAYYLFTEDVQKLKNTADPTQTQGTQVTKQQTDSASAGTSASAGQAGKAAADQSSVADPAKTTADQSSVTDPAKTTTDHSTAAADKPVSAQEHSASSAAGTTTDAASGKTKLTEQLILDKVAGQATSDQDFFTYNQLQQNDQLAEQLSKLTDKMANAKLSVEEQSQAQVQYDALEKQQAMTASIQEQLQKDGYTDSLIQQVSGKWNIVVKSGKLEKSQAVSIVDLATEVLNVGPEKIVIQYHK